ncbi:helix-turn-helix domain-containing protein [Thermoactinospora rubra]|uniref:helix-turn-helix domain-containing protein n=1 Tax=Thermoactinospora rubra TaxID=1088767 RepID=UPI00117D951C|nr:AraC family transcriptional regulator [Thermoactinospora rubra]
MVVPDSLAASHVPVDARRARLTAPWRVDGDGDHMNLQIVLDGAALAWDAGSPERRAVLRRGDILVSPAGSAYTSTHSPTESDSLVLTARYRTLGGSPAPAAVELPPLVIVPADPNRCGGLAAAVNLLAAETVSHPTANPVVLRAMQTLLILAFRAWTREGSGSVGRHRTSGDPLVERIIQAFHDDPARDWTLADLARSLSVSRATLTRRFAAGLGEGPLSHLTRLRMALAAERLRETDIPIKVIARSVGYTSPYAFSRAFTRMYGIAPELVRRRHRRTAGELVAN